MALLGVWPVFLWEPTGETGDPVLQRLVDPGTVGHNWSTSCMWPGGEVDFAGERQPHGSRWPLWWSWAIPQGGSGVANENLGLGGPPPSSPGLEQVMEPLSTRLSPPCLCTGHY